MTRTPPQHGERRCYIAGCRRPECVAANAAYCKQYRVARHRTGPKRVDAAPYAQHVRRYADLGWSRLQIAEQAGTSETTIVDLLSGQATRLNPSSAAAIRSLPAEPQDIPGRAYFDATGTIRRGRALYRIGHQVADMAADLGLHADSLSEILHRDGGLVLASTAHNMTALYKKLRWTPGKFIANRTRAANRDWHGPLAWDDATIDDPATAPDVDPHADKRGRIAKVDELLVARLTSEGRTAEQIAWDLGCHVRTVKRARGRAGDMAQAA